MCIMFHSLSSFRVATNKMLGGQENNYYSISKEAGTLSSKTVKRNTSFDTLGEEKMNIHKYYKSTGLVEWILSYLLIL